MLSSTSASGSVAEGDVGVGAEAERRRGVADVRRVHADDQPVRLEHVVDAQVEGGVPAGLGVQPGADGQGRPVVGVPVQLPGGPPHQAVAGVLQRRLAEAELEVRALEGVLAVPDPVGPGHQHLTATGAAYLVVGVAGHDVGAVDAVGAQAAAHLDDGGLLGTVPKGPLLAAGRGRHALTLALGASSCGSPTTRRESPRVVGQPRDVGQPLRLPVTMTALAPAFSATTSTESPTARALVRPRVSSLRT